MGEPAQLLAHIGQGVIIAVEESDFFFRKPIQCFLQSSQIYNLQCQPRTLYTSSIGNHLQNVLKSCNTPVNNSPDERI